MPLFELVSRVGPLLLALAWASIASQPASYPLEVTNIRAGLAAENRLSRAYPGLEYNVRAAVIGGVFPYTFQLADQPEGMTVDGRTGEITWPNPRADASPTLIVMDSAGARVSATWKIRVTAEGFRFVDAAAGRRARGNGCTDKCGTGTAANPWQTISDVYHNGQPGDFVYFRTGVYGVMDLPLTRPGEWQRAAFAESKTPVVWLAYPGQAPVLDFGYRPGSDTAPLIRFIGDNVYIDGWETVNSRYIAFQFESRNTGPTLRRLRMHRHGPGLRGANAAFILTLVSDTPSRHMVIQDSEFFDIVYGTGNCAIKVYSQSKLLVEDNVFRETDNGGEGVLALKQDVRQFTVRGNRFDVPGKAIGGNMSSSGNRETRTTSGEILFNNIRAGAIAIELNQNSQAAVIAVFRNTLVGRINIRNTDSEDGPFYFSRNVIINNDSGTPRDSRVSHENVTDPSRIVHTENLTGDPRKGIVNESGRLIGAYRRYVGVRGHELKAEAGTGPF